MPQCSQCGRPAIHGYSVPDGGALAFCLEHSLLYQQILDRRTEDTERMMNYLQDEMAYTIGLPPSGPRFPPRQRPVTIQNVRPTLNIQGSTVINTGTLQNVEVAIGAVDKTGNHELALAVAQLASAIAAAPDLDSKQKNNALEMLGTVAGEATVPPQDRKSATMRTVLGGLGEILKTSASAATLWEKVAPALTAAFS